MKNKMFNVLKGIGIVIIVIIVGWVMVLQAMCENKVANKNYNDSIARAVENKFPGSTIVKVLDREFEQEDNDVEFDLLVQMSNGKRKEIEVDCTCDCDGGSPRCRVDVW